MLGSPPEVTSRLPLLTPHTFLPYLKNAAIPYDDLAATQVTSIIAGFPQEIFVTRFFGEEMLLHTTLAGVAQLVEHHVANVVVVGSNPITRFSSDELRLCFLCRKAYVQHN